MALALAVVSVGIDVLVVAMASGAEVRRCADGYTNLMRVFWPSAVVVVVGAVGLLGHDLLIRIDSPQERLASRYLVPALVFAPVAVACVWFVLKAAPEMPFFD